MSSTIDITTVTASIAALSISGVVVKDLTGVGDMKISPGTLTPWVPNFVSGFIMNHDEITQTWNRVTYSLTYRYFHSAPAGGMGLGNSINSLMTAIGNILLAFSTKASISGSIDVENPTVSNIGIVQDPSGNDFFGCDIALDVIQFLEV